MVAPKIGFFFQVVILGNIGLENVFYEVLKRKNAFQGYENKKLKNLQSCDFSKGLVSPWVCSKIGIFLMLLF